MGEENQAGVESAGVEADAERKAVNIKWDANALEGDTVDLKAENADDVSTRPDIPNDGYAVITYPADYHGTSKVTISDESGNSVEGEITV